MNRALAEYGVVTVLCAAIFISFYFGSCFRWWWPAWRQAGFGLLRLFRARWRGVPPRILVQGALLAKEGGLEIGPNEIELFYLSGGGVLRSIAALIAAKRADIEFSFKKAQALVLEGRDPLEVVRDLVRVKHGQLEADAGRTDPETVHALLGARGSVEYAVPPVGIVEVNNMRVYAMSDGGFIDKGASVDIVGVRGNVAVVRPAAMD